MVDGRKNKEGVIRPDSNLALLNSSRMEAINRRLKIFSFIFLAFYGLTFIYLFSALGPGLTDRHGQPLGRDFSHFWAAASLAWSGEPGAIYDFPRLQAFGEAIFGPGTAIPWLYPPTFLLIILPFALLPYFVSLGFWILPALAGYLWVMRSAAPHPLTLWLTLAFPGTYQNLRFGQNGFLSATLLGGGLLLLERFPITAGILLGLLSYKPHLLVLVVVALAAGRYWGTLLAAAIVSVTLVIVSLLVMGPQVWSAFFKSTPPALAALQAGLLPWKNIPLHLWNMPTVFCGMLEAGASSGTAQIAQAAVMLAMAAVVGWAWLKGAPLVIRASLLVLGILLFTPYAAVYDLVLLALPLAWLGWDGFTRGWLPGERPLLFLAWLMPMVFPYLARVTHVQLAPFVLILLVILAWRRWRKYPIAAVVPSGFPDPGA
jgi:hypothetical protein